MKIKYLKSLKATVTHDGQSWSKEVDTDYRYFDLVNHGPFTVAFYNTLKVNNVSIDGDVTISYMFSEAVTPRYFVLNEENPKVEIVDYVNLHNPDKENARVNIVVEVEYGEVETELELHIREYGRDDSHKTIEEGLEEYDVKVNELPAIKSRLVKNTFKGYFISKVQGSCVYLIDNEKKQEVVVSPFIYYVDEMSSGWNYQHDYQTWNWQIIIKMNIKDAVMFKRS